MSQHRFETRIFRVQFINTSPEPTCCRCVFNATVLPFLKELAAGVEKDTSRTHYTFPSEGTRNYKKILGQQEYSKIYSNVVHFSKGFL